MFEWIEDRWIIYATIAVLIVILMDEFAYHHWKRANPGHLYSHLRGRTITPIDPSRPPFTYYE